MFARAAAAAAACVFSCKGSRENMILISLCKVNRVSLLSRVCILYDFSYYVTSDSFKQNIRLQSLGNG